jgi:hypothetical protein
LDPRACLVGDSTTQDLRILHCQRIIALVEEHFRTQIPGDYSTFFLSGLFNVCLTLVPSLASLVSAELFTRAVMVLNRTVVDLPGMRQILRGIQAVVWGMKNKIPEAARASFENIEPPSNSVEVNKEWGFPQLEYLQSDPGAAVGNLQNVGGSLGKMIELWEKS